ncbi:MAG: DUF418 domain-containing protein [Bryobacteraceae bacterium]|nr:DUF418 domain-containing protein [Bryobacteraceae bacterium]
MTAFAPVRAEERISSLDTLRGFALLGILLMNIVGFGLHNAYDNPLVAGGAEGFNLAAWITMHILAEGKMRCLFSMVFGAGVVLLTGRAEDRGAGSQVADIFLRRNLWLMLFGAFHAYLLWQGEILYPYGLCALALYPFRKLQARTLIILGAVLVIGSAAGNLVTGYVAMDTLSKGAAAEQLAKSGVKLTPEQEEIRKKREEMLKEDRPSPEEVEKANTQWRGSLWEVLKIRGKIVWRWHNLAYYHILHLDLFSMMFLGMGFYKLGIFSAARSPKFYVLLALAGYALGVTVNSFTAWTIVKSNWDLPTRLFCFTVYDVGRLSIALAHLGVLMLLCQKGWFGFVLRPLTAIGQTALSNYVFHSVVCATLFTGVGFGLFGKLQRYELYFVVLTIWAVQMAVSPLWLKHYRFGPLEWGWRSLTYWQKQPMKI